MRELDPSSSMEFRAGQLAQCQLQAHLVTRHFLRSRKLAEEAAETAIFKLEVRVALFDPPECPVSWVRIVARHEAFALSKAPRNGNISLEDLGFEPLSACPRAESCSRLRDHLHMHLEDAKKVLTDVQRQVLLAVLEAPEIKAAAVLVGKTPRNTRWICDQIAKKIRKVVPPPPSM